MSKIDKQEYCHIDIETFSEENLKKSGVYRYAQHPSTEVHCLMYRFGHDGPVHVWIPRDEIPDAAYPDKIDFDSAVHVQREMPKDLRRWIKKGGQLRAWNAMFERVVLRELGRTGRIDWPKVPLEQWFCTMAKAAAHALRQALGNAAADCGTYPKDETGKMVMLQLAKPRKPSKTNPATRWTIEETPDRYRELYNYCVDDVLAESSLDEYIPELSPGEVKAYHLDQRINDRGIYIDLASVKSAQVLIEEYKAELRKKCKELTGFTPGQTAALADWVRDEGYDIENLQKATVGEALKDDSCPDHVKRVLRIYRTHNMKAVMKYKAMELATCDDGRLRGMFQYHAATTGRWSSRIVQLQNLFRSVIGDEDRPGEEEELAIGQFALEDLDFFRSMWDPNPLKVLASCVRGMLIAASGKKLRAIDYAAIEARVVAWLAGQLDILEVFETDGRIYEFTAAKIYGIPIDQVTKEQRFIGKIAVLALGYQGGKKAFAKMAKQYGVEISEEFADKIKEDWRKVNQFIVKFWYAMEEHAAAAIANPGKIYKVNDKIMFKVEGDWLYMRLPSGRRLAYFKPALDSEGKPTFMGIDTYTRRWQRCKTYGGKLTENAVQAIARDLLLHAMHGLEEAGYELIGTVHDEVIAENDDDFGSFEEASEIMCQLPSWAEGLPVGVDGFEALRYRK